MKAKEARLGMFPLAFLYAIKLMANSEERELIETQPSLFQAEGEIIAHGLEEVFEGQQDGALPLVDVAATELEVGFGHRLLLGYSLYQR